MICVNLYTTDFNMHQCALMHLIKFAISNMNFDQSIFSGCSQMYESKNRI